jgi:hypothetical protein
MRAQSMEFSELNVEFGYSYQSAAVVPDGRAATPAADEIRVYQPSTRPGAPLPHAAAKPGRPVISGWSPSFPADVDITDHFCNS